MTVQKFRDPADSAAFQVSASYPSDSAEDVFAECLDSMRMQGKFALFPKESDAIFMEAFRVFWEEWQQVSAEPTHTNGEEAAIALLQTMKDDRTYETSLEAYCWLFAIGRTPLSQTEIAAEITKRHGLPTPLTRATVCERVQKIVTRLGLPPSRGMKSEGARVSSAIRAIKVHTQNKKCNQKPSLFSQHLTLIASMS